MHKRNTTVTYLVLFLFLFASGCQRTARSWIRINQLGYLADAKKVAVLISHRHLNIESFTVVDADSGNELKTIYNVQKYTGPTVFKSCYYFDFSELTTHGNYYLKAKSIRSEPFKVGDDIYSGAADFLLHYMRQQRCGYNPYYMDSCHTHDGFIVFHPDPAVDSTYIDVTGGWHDAADYLQYAKTSVNAVFQMILAYSMHPYAFGDGYNAEGLEEPNGTPDIVDEVKWGLEWMLKMYPENGVLFKQIADDRDHAGFRLPMHDSVNYGKGLERPVYYSTGEIQGYDDRLNRTTGKASLAGKFASAFMAASILFEDQDPDYSGILKEKALQAYELGKAYPGYCQTNPCGAPYFYEEENWVDDMELAATQLYIGTRDATFLHEARTYGSMEPVTPWMGADTARHYQWYPFLNLGHYFLAVNETGTDSKVFTNYLREGLEAIEKKASENPFYIGVPFIWCSNNLVAATLTQCCLYRKITGDTAFLRMEAALRDWLFGCNPWGTSMIIGLPDNGDYPADTHSSPGYILKRSTPGGLVDGPVYPGIFNSLKGLYLSGPDEYAAVQPGFAVYHDDFADYSTNEPTMDGTASLTYYLSALEKEGLDLNQEP